jgi:hypothetical protein
MEPHGTSARADRGDEGAAIGGDFDSLFFGDTESDLLQGTIREALAPDDFVNSMWPTLIFSFGPPKTPITSVAYFPVFGDRGGERSPAPPFLRRV